MTCTRHFRNDCVFIRSPVTDPLIVSVTRGLDAEHGAFQVFRLNWFSGQDKTRCTCGYDQYPHITRPAMRGPLSPVVNSNVTRMRMVEKSTVKKRLLSSGVKSALKKCVTQMGALETKTYCRACSLFFLGH